MNIEELKNRWIKLLRLKASEYEHEARKNNKVISSPDIDDICNEIESFFTGLENTNNRK